MTCVNNFRIEDTYKGRPCLNCEKLKVITRTWLQRRLSSCVNLDPTQPASLLELARCLEVKPPDEGPCRRPWNQFILGASNGPILNLQVF